MTDAIVCCESDDCAYVPYALLHASPVTLRLSDNVPVTLTLCDLETALVSVSADFLMIEETPKRRESKKNNAHSVRVGTSFILEYRGKDYHIRLGRRIVMTDGLSHTLL